MIDYRRSSHSTHSALTPLTTIVVRAVAVVLHTIMPSSLFVSWVEDMLVLIRLKFSGNLVAMP